MTSDSKAKMLERVRALLAKADSTTFPAEADSFRDKADELMTAYAIEQWQVDAAQAGVGARPEPERREVDISWWYENSRADELWFMMNRVADHCRVKLVWWRAKQRQMPAVGLASDLDYFDMLFTHLMLQMGKGLEPHPDPNKPMIENLVVMKEAGMKWERIGELLINIGQLDSYSRNVGVRFTKLYTDYCDEHQRPRLRTSPSVYQRSYANGFVMELSHRLQRQANERTGDLLPVLRDIRDQVNDAAHEMFGSPPKSRGGTVSREMTVDHNAYHAGKVDGSKASISANPNAGVKRGVAGELT